MILLEVRNNSLSLILKVDSSTYLFTMPEIKISDSDKSLVFKIPSLEQKGMVNIQFNLLIFKLPNLHA